MYGSLVRAIERRFIYLPERTLKGTPAHIGLEYEDVRFRAVDGARLHGWWVPGRTPAAWLFFHGNGGNISARLDQLLDIHRRIGAGVFTFDYRGYGLSEGVPSEEGTLLDAQAALRELTLRLAGPAARVVYFGRSMGGAIATRLAVQRPPAGLILESPPTSMPDMARLHVPWMRFSPLPRIMRTRYETQRHIRQVTAPLLVIQGDSDDVVPVQFGRRVFVAANEPKQWLLVPGAGHNFADRAAPDLYYNAVREFLTRFGAL
jgi:fermentation-respiration switch protein FrsA (DUF1100 family)